MLTLQSLITLLGSVLVLTLMYSGVRALVAGELQFFNHRRRLLGPSAQLCGLALLAPLPISLISCGSIGHAFGARPDPGMLWQRLTADSGAGDKDPETQKAERNLTISALLGNIVFDLAVIGVPWTLVIFLLVDSFGAPPPRRRHRGQSWGNLEERGASRDVQ